MVGSRRATSDRGKALDREKRVAGRAWSTCLTTSQRPGSWAFPAIDRRLVAWPQAMAAPGADFGVVSSGGARAGVPCGECDSAVNNVLSGGERPPGSAAQAAPKVELVASSVPAELRVDRQEERLAARQVPAESAGTRPITQAT